MSEQTIAKPTPGPWEIDGPGIYEVGQREIYRGVNEDGKPFECRLGLIALPYEPSGVLPARPNAHLIASAPEMFDALNGLIGLVQLITHRNDLPDGIRLALIDSHRYREALAVAAKAEGRAS